MKRLLIVLLFTVFLTSCESGLIDCKNNDNVSGICVDTTPPNIEGINDSTVIVHTVFHPLDDITAVDDMDGDITDHIEVVGHVDTDQVGTYLLRYMVSDDAGNTDIKLRYVTVRYDYSGLSSILINGDFSQHLENIDLYEEIGAEANYAVINEELVVEVLGMKDGIWYSPRISMGQLILQNGSTYHVTLKAKAEDSRMIQIQVGELLSYDPWFTDYAPNISKVIALDSTFQVYEFEFTVLNPTCYACSILFEFGDVGTNNYSTTVTIDDVTIVEMNR